MKNSINGTLLNELNKINQKIVSGVHYKQVFDYIFDSLQGYLNSNHMNFQFANVDILEFFDEVIPNAKIITSKKNITLKVNIGGKE